MACDPRQAASPGLRIRERGESFRKSVSLTGLSGESRVPIGRGVGTTGRRAFALDSGHSHGSTDRPGYPCRSSPRGGNPPRGPSIVARCATPPPPAGRARRPGVRRRVRGPFGAKSLQNRVKYNTPPMTTATVRRPASRGGRVARWRARSGSSGISARRGPSRTLRSRPRRRRNAPSSRWGRSP